VEAARFVVLHAAWKMDTVGNKAAWPEIAMAKVLAAQTACRVADRAIQVHGGLGLTDDVPLAAMYRYARILRLGDGADEVHKAKLAEQGLKPASGVKLPYDLPSASFARAVDEGPRLAALAGWFAAGAEILEELRRKYKRFKPGPSPVRCWPHHFDIAILVGLEEGGAEHAKAIGIGLSPGDDYYAQPYFYLSPYPTPDTENLPALPPGGRWHTHEFFGAVATGVEMLALDDPRGGILAVVDAAFEESLKRLGRQAG